MSECLDCGRGFHDECGDPCCCNSQPAQPTFSPDPVEKKSRRQEVVSVSAGRKRAAVDYKLDPDMPCEWRGKVNCGGGYEPIFGCLLGFQEARHHGPDKNTDNNEPDNVNLICHACHNLWHRRNDPRYGDNKCPDDIQSNEPRWATRAELASLGSRKNG